MVLIVDLEEKEQDTTKFNRRLRFNYQCTFYHKNPTRQTTTKLAYKMNCKQSILT